MTRNTPLPSLSDKGLSKVRAIESALARLVAEAAIVPTVLMDKLDYVKIAVCGKRRNGTRLAETLDDINVASAVSSGVWSLSIRTFEGFAQMKFRVNHIFSCRAIAQHCCIAVNVHGRTVSFSCF